MSFFSSVLAKLHDEFNSIRGAAHVPTQLHDLMDELVGRFHALEARVEDALKPHEPRVITDAHIPVSPEPATAAPEKAPEAGPVGVTTTLTVPVAPMPVEPAPAPADTPASHASPGIIAILGSEPVSATPAATTPDSAAQDPATSGAPGGYTGHDLTPGHPRINVENAGAFAEYRFTGPGTVYYQICSGCDSGMRVTSYIGDASGVAISETETRVIMNKQPFTVTASGPSTFYVKPEATGPISVGME